MQARTHGAERQLGPDLGHNERLVDATEQIAVAQDGRRVDAKGRRDQGSVREVALAALDQAREPVGHPCL
jgi:hypothetical protein